MTPIKQVLVAMQPNIDHHANELSKSCNLNVDLVFACLDGLERIKLVESCGTPFSKTYRLKNGGALKWAYA
jgi:hypothetical protein